MTTMERCLTETPLRRLLDIAKEMNNDELITEIEMMLEDEEDLIKKAYQDAVDFVIIGIVMDDEWPTADEYYEELFTTDL
jgi:hypothetical protein